ncbi:phage tail domain-containing protein [Paenibacillus durus]|uniref:phage tail domain-containing protein n=1 Tax=Paenibacillus durus TaxID=44251 RepID=UPI0005AA53B9|nr:phage tail domain-containing protein [Paenibacillus durus]
MTYDVAVNGVWLSTQGASLFERKLPVLPETDDNTVKIAGTDGVIDFGGSYGARTLGLTFEITVSGADFHRTVAYLARTFNAKRGEITLEFNDMPGKYYRATYAGTLALGATGSRLIDVSLRMNDPWPTGSEVVTEFTITNSPQSVSITSAADVPAEPVITLTNTGSNTIYGFTIKNEYEIE